MYKYTISLDEKYKQLLIVKAKVELNSTIKNYLETLIKKDLDSKA